MSKGKIWVLISVVACPTLWAQAPPAAPAKFQIHGHVLDDQDLPVRGATVSGVGYLYHPVRSSTTYFSIPDRTADQQGAFTIEINAGDQVPVVYLRARHKRAVTAKLTWLHAEALRKPLVLRISAKNAGSLSVRVVDEAGKPVAGAAVTIKHLGFDNPQIAANWWVVVSPEEKPGAGWTTDAEGRFQTPPFLDLAGGYQLEVKAQGFFTEQTPLKNVGQAKAFEFGDLVLRRQRTLEGRVLDRGGKPVTGARILWTDGRDRLTATADADGRFKLRASFYPLAFLFVDKSGFRFHGQRCDKPAPLDMALTRRDEPVANPLTTFPPALPRVERTKLSARILEPYLRRTLEKSDDSARFVALQILAKLDPGRVLEELERRPYKEAWIDSAIRAAVVKRLVQDGLDEARSVVDSMKDPSYRCRGYLDLYDARPNAKPADKLALLNQALLHNRSVTGNEHRILHLAGVARRLCALGEKDRATRLLREGEAIAMEMPTAASGGYARGVFAQDLALIDGPGALALMKDLKDPSQYVRHHGNLAHKLAGVSPAEAERLFGLVMKVEGHPWVYGRDEFAVRICYRMAAVDLSRARKIADSVQRPSVKARAFGAMAEMLAKNKPKEAREMLDRAFDNLAKHLDSGKDQFDNLNAMAVAGLMVPVAEHIDRNLTAEFFWRALSLRRRALPPEYPDEWGLEPTSLGGLGMLIARYDRELAMAFVVEAPNHVQKQTHGRFHYLTAAAIADPLGAVALVERLPDDASQDEARRQVAGILLAQGDEVWRAVHRALIQWYADDEDL